MTRHPSIHWMESNARSFGAVLDLLSIQLNINRSNIAFDAFDIRYHHFSPTDFIFVLFLLGPGLGGLKLRVEI